MLRECIYERTKMVERGPVQLQTHVTSFPQF